jgi:hypothetical protein
MSTPNAQGLESEYKVQSQVHGVQLERYEEGDEGGQAEGLQEGEDCLEIGCSILWKVAAFKPI